jgi:hypothetical protein
MNTKTDTTAEQAQARAAGYRWSAMEGAWGARNEAAKRYPVRSDLMEAFLRGVENYYGKRP